METWLALTIDGGVPCGTLHFFRLDGRYGYDRLINTVYEILGKHRKLGYNGAIVYKGRITEYDNPSRTLFTIGA